jgi:hypothetical protein
MNQVVNKIMHKHIFLQFSFIRNLEDVWVANLGPVKNPERIALHTAVKSNLQLTIQIPTPCKNTVYRNHEATFMSFMDNVWPILRQFLFVTAL